jgi:putative ABC transport system permease protein
MTMLRWIRTRLSSLFRRGRYERELDSELLFHLDMLAEQNVAAGMPRDEARRAALRAFGQVDRIKDEVRDTWLSRVAETFTQDLRYGLRGIRRGPGFALAVVFTMALGIGANSAIFSVVNGVLLKPLPYEKGEQLVVLRQQQPLADVDDMGFSYQEILDYRTATSLDGVVEFHNMWFILLGRPEPERVSTGVVSANFFDVLGVQPLYGRLLQDADDRPGGACRSPIESRVLAAQLWRRSWCCREAISDERPSAPGGRCAAAGAAISTGSRRVHANVGVSVSFGALDGHRARPPDDDGVRAHPGGREAS